MLLRYVQSSAGVYADTRGEVHILRRACGSARDIPSRSGSGANSIAGTSWLNPAKSFALKQADHEARKSTLVSLWLQALRRATWMPEIPAHRVIKASGDIGGFGGTAGLSQTPVQRKKALLEAEGLEFQVVDMFSTVLPAEPVNVFSRRMNLRDRNAASGCATHHHRRPTRT